MPDLGQACVTGLKVIQASALRLTRQEVLNAHVISSWDKLIGYCNAVLAREPVEQVRVLFFGVPKDAATLETILDPTTFPGIVISDDAAVYADFTNSQKCWAHLLRKAIGTIRDMTGEIIGCRGAEHRIDEAYVRSMLWTL